MKKNIFILLFFILLFSASVSHAESDNLCMDVVYISGEVMDARQHNVTKNVMLQYAKSRFTGGDYRVYVVLINEAYKVAVEQTENRRLTNVYRKSNGRV